MSRRVRWTALMPLPEALLAGVDLREDRWRPRPPPVEHAYALSLQLGDPCWECVAARGIGLAANLRGDPEAALRWVAEARARAGHRASATRSRALGCGPGGAGHAHGDAGACGARIPAPWSPGDEAAAEAARILAAEADNPALLRLI